jgi:hypothetical protein
MILLHLSLNPAHPVCTSLALSHPHMPAMLIVVFHLLEKSADEPGR